MQPVYLAAVGMTKFGKSTHSLTELLCEAATSALSISHDQAIEAIFVGAMNPEEFTGAGNIAAETAEALGLTGIPALRVETASSAGAAALHAGFQAIASGYYRHVLVVGGEKMTDMSTAATTRILAEVIDRQERLCGATMPALAAMITESYRKRYRLSHARLQRMLCAIAVKNHFNGCRNSCAQFQKPISEKDYLASKLVATPLRLYDCAPITDGAAAVMLTAEKTDLTISGLGQGTGPTSLRHRDCFTSFPATQIAAKRAYEMAGVNPRDIDFAEVHDAFTPFEIISTEDLGFFLPGKGGEAAAVGRTAPDGDLPVNLSGGLKARGHPIGASGVAQVVEVVKRLRGEVGLHLKRDVTRALTQSTGGLGANNFVTIVERAGQARSVQNLWTPPPQTERRQARTEPPPGMDHEGRLETFTILYVTPDGFLAPLALGLIRDRHGRFLFACGEDIEHLKVDREVYVRRVDDYYSFTVKSQLQKVKQAFSRFLRSFSDSRVRKQTRSKKSP
jgi:acetyl-CoA C-acetyltransferase